GPESAETSAGSLDPEVLIAHSFTLPEPAARGGSQIFPYALAATRDGIGVWAHEVGHLFGLPDLYVANSLCPETGLGEWSLMATGANRSGGDSPTGLDAFSLQLLGMTPQFDDGSGVLLSQGVFLRASNPGEETGPRYYLVDYREAGDGPAGNTPARVVYLINEEAVDNRSCSNPSDTYRPLVRVAGVICPGSDICTDSFYEACELCPNVGFTFQNTLVHAQSGALPPVVLSRVKLGIPQVGSSGFEEQRVFLSFHNVDTDAEHTVSVDVNPVDFDSVCTARTVLEVTVSPGDTAVDSSLTLVPCDGSGALPREDVLLALRVFDNLWSRADTVVLPANQVGWDIPNFCGFASRSLDPERTSPWSASVSFPPCPPDCCPNLMAAVLLAPLAHGELVSPWISIPPAGRLTLPHEWKLAAPSPDVALDAAQVRLRRSVGEDIALEPPLGWGYTAERGIGNALGGQSVLSGSGSRVHVFDLSAWSGEIAQVVFVVAGNAEVNPSVWKLWPLTVQSGPEITFTIMLDPSDPGTLIAETSSTPRAIQLTLFQGWPGVAPTDTVFSGPWNGQARMVLGRFEGPESRFELVWTDSTSAASTGAILDLPVSAQAHFLLVPSPNPLHGGDAQTWAIRVADNGPMGTYRLRLVGLNGGVILEHSVRIDVPGTRLIPWDGRDREGRTISSGMYFLEARRPDGVTNGQRVVVLR
ncbi:MAG TPA: immune inhibitor A domain-containing protein, partial [Candidatus Eisenbacteria bacterium]|nr:immune inhibitor A domain-containing protein [Candidatus Eisenbacteria bacterium]